MSVFWKTVCQFWSTSTKILIFEAFKMLIIANCGINVTILFCKGLQVLPIVFSPSQQY